MKTLLVLSALASIVLAAPTLQEEGFEDIHHVPLTSAKTSELSTGSIPHGANTKVLIDAGTSLHTGRNILSKKPLIVKKKFGYRLYRDSEEEKAHADSQESCGRQVKVKLCDEDGKFREMLKNSAHEISNVHATTDDMKLSIRMAKEAVENLQRDLMKMEHKNPAMKMAHDSETDSDLHEDIEVARQALEHIHTNFGDLETMSLHATASRDSEGIHDVHIILGKSEEEKMAQWKEAMENIHKNVEIARNIEDSFKSANHEDSLLHLDQSDTVSHVINEHKLEDITSHVVSNEEHHMRGAETTPLNIQVTEKEHSEHGLTDKTTIGNLTNDHAREEPHMEDDMNPSASEAIEMKTVDIDNHHTLRSENHELHNHMKSADAALEKHETDIHNTELQGAAPIDTSSLITSHQPLFTVKQAKEQTEPKLEDNNVLFKTSKNVAENHKTGLPVSIKTLTPQMVDEHPRNTEEKELEDKTGHHELHEITSEEIKHLNDLHTKSVKHLDDDQKEDINKNTAISKTAEIPKPESENHHIDTFETKLKDASSNIDTGDKDNNDKLTKTVQEIHLHKLNNVAEQIENSMRTADLTLPEQNMQHKIDHDDSDSVHVAILNGIKSAEHHLHHHSPSSKSIEQHLHHQAPSMKSVESNFHHHAPLMNSAESHLHHHLVSMNSAESHLRHVETAPTTGRWAHEHRHLAAKEPTEEFHRKDFNEIDHNIMRNSHQAEHRFTPTKMGVTHDFETSQHVHTPVGYHNHKMHEITGMSDGTLSSKFHPSMREAMDGFGSEHMYRWAPTHEYRNAYGSSLPSPIGSSRGAVGVFPNANTGGCGIPLLLSCSPSVVSGSLAKGQSSYSGPSYRTEDDFSFHNKRDIKNTNELRSTNILRTPAIVKQKTGTILENQL